MTGGHLSQEAAFEQRWWYWAKPCKTNWALSKKSLEKRVPNRENSMCKSPGVWFRFGIFTEQKEDQQGRSRGSKARVKPGPLERERESNQLRLVIEFTCPRVLNVPVCDIWYDLTHLLYRWGNQSLERLRCPQDAQAPHQGHPILLLMLPLLSPPACRTGPSLTWSSHTVTHWPPPVLFPSQDGADPLSPQGGHLRAREPAFPDHNPFFWSVSVQGEMTGDYNNFKNPKGQISTN